MMILIHLISNKSFISHIYPNLVDKDGFVRPINIFGNIMTWSYFEEENISLCWTITPNMRELWDDIINRTKQD